MGGKMKRTSEDIGREKIIRIYCIKYNLFTVKN